MKKRAAMELSVGTIVIIVIAMLTLILGIVLVKNIFEGSSDNILTMNDKVKDQINKLFVEGKKTVVYASNQKVEIEQNEEWGVAFAIKNLERGTSEVGNFEYEVKLSDPEGAKKRCGIGEADIMNWIQTGRTSKVAISPGDTYYGIVRFMIPENSPLCMIRFNIEIMKDGKLYATDFFDVQVEA